MVYTRHGAPSTCGKIGSDQHLQGALDALFEGLQPLRAHGSVYHLRTRADDEARAIKLKCYRMKHGTDVL